MRDLLRLSRYNLLLPVVLGLSDGILLALTLAAGRLVSSAQPIGWSLAIRIAIGALASGAFVFFVATYSSLRGDLMHAERQLNVTSRGQLASSRLGLEVLVEAGATTLVSSVADFLGALVPLVPAVLLPRIGLGSVVASLLALGVLGLVLARVVHGTYWRWCLSLLLGGSVLTLLGAKLSLV